jgi:hypothetical protein
MRPFRMATHVASLSHNIMLYVVVLHGSHVRDGWDLIQRKPTVVFVCRHVLPYADVAHCENARQGSASFEKEHILGWTLSMQR